MMEGRLIEFGKRRKLHAFESGKRGSPRVLIALGGMGDGLMWCKYLQPLSEELEKLNIAMVQPLLRSSFMQFGTGTLVRDAKDLAQLLETLDGERNLDSVSFLGHSTGCQIACWFLRSELSEFIRSRTHTVILQAPVSDREGLVQQFGRDTIDSKVALAKEALRKGKSSEIIMSIWGSPTCAERVVDLCAEKGRDDMFSSDLEPEYLRQVLGHLSKFQTLICLSLADEYVPAGVYPELGHRLRDAVANSKLLLLQDADHGINAQAPLQTFVKTVVDMLSESSRM